MKRQHMGQCYVSQNSLAVPRLPSYSLHLIRCQLLISFKDLPGGNGAIPKMPRDRTCNSLKERHLGQVDGF